MERKDLKNKYNEYYKEFKKKEWYQLSQFDKLFILLLDIAENTDKVITTNTTTNTNTVESKTLKIEFNSSNFSNPFTLPSKNTLLINPKLDKDITVNLQIGYNDRFIDTNLFIDIPKDTQLVTTDLNQYSAIINKKDSCRLCSNEVITATFLMYYV